MKVKDILKALPNSLPKENKSQLYKALTLCSVFSFGKYEIIKVHKECYYISLERKFNYDFSSKSWTNKFTENVFKNNLFDCLDAIEIIINEDNKN